MSAQLQDIRVLLAEDDFLIAAHLSQIMADEGAVVTVIGSVRELSEADLSLYDIAVLDNTLSDGEIGSAVNRFVEAGVPLVHQSGDDVAGAEARNIFAAVLGKPIKEDELISAISDHGKSAKHRQE